MRPDPGTAGALSFEQLGGRDLVEWLERSRRGYIDALLAAGATQEEAATNAEQSMERLFPGGAPAPGQLVGTVVVGGTRIGDLWIGPYEDDPARWWVWDVVIDEPLRSQGYGRRTMALAERLAAAHGATSLGLNVFAHNEVARHLYRSLGYEETAVQMRKALDGDALPADA